MGGVESSREDHQENIQDLEKKSQRREADWTMVGQSNSRRGRCRSRSQPPVKRQFSVTSSEQHANHNVDRKENNTRRNENMDHQCNKRQNFKKQPKNNQKQSIESNDPPGSNNCQPKDNFKQQQQGRKQNHMPRLQKGKKNHLSSEDLSSALGGILKISPKQDKLIEEFRLIEMHKDPRERVKGFIQNDIRVMILMRGAPGCGKTTLAKGILLSFGLSSSEHIISADDYFVNEEGMYSFNAENIGKAHEWAQNIVKKEVNEGFSPIFVDNTNTRLWEMRVYAQLAISNGYVLETIEPSTEWSFNLDQLFKKNSHSVPKSVIRNMLDRYERGLSGKKIIEKLELKYPEFFSPPLNTATVTRKSLSSAQVVRTTDQNKTNTNSVVNSDQRNVNQNRKNMSLPQSKYGNRVENYPNTNEQYKFQTNYIKPLNQNSNFSHQGVQNNLFSESSNVPPTNYVPLTNNVPPPYNIIFHKDNLRMGSVHPIPMSNSTPVNYVPAPLFQNEQLTHNGTFSNIMVSHPVNPLVGVPFVRTLCPPIGTHLQNSPNPSKFHVPKFDRNPVIHQNRLQERKARSEKTKNDVSTVVSDFFSKNSPPLRPNLIDFGMSDSADPTPNLFDLELLSLAMLPPNSNNESCCWEYVLVEPNGTIIFQKEHEDAPTNLEDFKQNAKEDEKKQENKINLTNRDISSEDITVTTENSTKSDSLSGIPSISCQVKSDLSPYQKIPDQLEMKSQSSVVNEDACQSPQSEILFDPDLKNPKNELQCLLTENLKKKTSELSLLKQKTNELPHFDCPNLKSENINSSIFPITESEQKHVIKSPILNFSESSSKEENSYSGLQQENSSLSFDNGFSSVSFMKLVVEKDKIEKNKTEATLGKHQMNVILKKESQDLNSWDQELPGNLLKETWKESEFHAPSISLTVPREQRNKLKKDISTITHYRDFVAVSKLNSGGSEEYLMSEGLAVKIITESSLGFQSILSSSKGIIAHNGLDKGTMTDENQQAYSSPVHKSLLDRLKRMFPSLDTDQLSDLLLNCNNDINWTADLLLDSGHELVEYYKDFDAVEEDKDISKDFEKFEKRDQSLLFLEYQKQTAQQKDEKKRISPVESFIEKNITQSSFSKEIVEKKKDDVDRSSEKKDGIDQISEETSETSQNMVNKKSTIEEPNLDEKECTSEDEFCRWNLDPKYTKNWNGCEITLDIPSSLINQLQSNFGGLVPPLSNSLKVQLPASLARHLHCFVMDSLVQELNSQEEMIQKMDVRGVDDEIIARKLQKEEILGPNLQDIMDNELAISIQKSINKKGGRESIASHMSRKLLSEKFPNLDHRVLDEVLKDCGNSLQSATSLLVLAGHKPQSDISQNTGNQSNVGEGFLSKQEVIKQAEAFKEVARRLTQVRHEYFNKAQAAYHEGNTSVASYYSHIARNQLTQIEEANILAATTIFTGTNISSTTTLDLHFLQVKESVEILDLFLDAHIMDLGMKRFRVLYIITGRGIHSFNGPKVKPAIIQRLNNRQIKFELENPGLIKVLVNRETSLSSDY